MPDKNQCKLIHSLQNFSLYPHDTDQFELIETHISWIILCGPYAYKLKKALNLGFLDFSTLGKRKFYCEEELRLNGRLAPELYLAVVAITGTAERPQLGGAGEAIEYAVKMRRFPQQTLLSQMLEQDRLTHIHIDQIITQVARFHQAIPAAATEARYGEIAQLSAPVQENFMQIRECMRDSQQLELLTRIETWAEHQQQLCEQSFQQRKEQGFIRECHGDMHLGNMVVIDDRVVIFDGIEFNPDLYWIDIMSEVAFLCMDLEYHHKSDFAWRFLNGYLEWTGDYQGLRVFRYYLAYRAMVRAKVAAIRLGQQAERNLQSAEAQQVEGYLRLAFSYTQLQQPVLLITHGLSGSGKSTLSAPLIEPMAALRIRSDRERQRMFGKGGKKDEVGKVAQGVYSSDATRQTYGKLVELAEAVLQSGYSAIIDATFLERQQRDYFKQLADRLGVPMRILFFQADADVLRRRIRQRQRAGRDISEADVSVLEHQLTVYRGLDDDEQDYTVSIDTRKVFTAENILAQVRQSFGQAPVSGA